GVVGGPGDFLLSRVREAIAQDFDDAGGGALHPWCDGTFDCAGFIGAVVRGTGSGGGIGTGAGNDQHGFRGTSDAFDGLDKGAAPGALARYGRHWAAPAGSGKGRVVSGNQRRFVVEESVFILSGPFHFAI